jgi:periplasmic nitrate reductase NapD
MSRAMIDRQPMPAIDRRKFLNARWPARAGGDEQTNTEKADAPAEIASILVHVRPERLEQVTRAIAALPGAEIYSRSPQGKLVAVLEASSTCDIAATLNTISSMPHVLTAGLVFHATDEG